MASRRKTLSHEASSDMLVVRWTRLPYLQRSRLPGTSELETQLLGRLTGLGRGSTAGLASELTKLPTTSPNTRHELSLDSETVIAPVSWFALLRGRRAVRRYAHTFLPKQLVSRPAAQGPEDSWDAHTRYAHSGYANWGYAGTRYANARDAHSTPTQQHAMQRHAQTLRTQLGQRGGT